MNSHSDPSPAMLIWTLNLVSSRSLLVNFWVSFPYHVLFKQLIWTSNNVLVKLMRCNKVKQLSPQYDSHHQMKEKRRKRLYYNWFIRIGWGCWIFCTQQIILSGMHVHTCTTCMYALVCECACMYCTDRHTHRHTIILKTDMDYTTQSLVMRKDIFS